MTDITIKYDHGQMLIHLDNFLSDGKIAKVRRWFSLRFLPMCGISMQFLGFFCIGPENSQTSFLPACDKKEEHL